jgi:di- and tripeptidase
MNCGTELPLFEAGACTEANEVGTGEFMLFCFGHVTHIACSSLLPDKKEESLHASPVSLIMSSVLGFRRRLTENPSNTGSETDEQLLPRRPSFPPLNKQQQQQQQQQQKQQEEGAQQHNLPSLSHRLRHDASILALALSDTAIFAGTQRGEIIVYSLDTYDRIALLEAHKGSVLDLCLCEDEKLLFSSAADRITNVWDLNTFRHVYSLYSRYDTGDVFCVTYSSLLRTVYLGAQNTSIQWYDLKEKDQRPKPQRGNHPSLRQDPFFDSRGPGGVRTPRPADQGLPARHAAGGEVLEIDQENIKHFAHYGYVYCMMLAKGVVPDAPGDQVLISAGGDGAINLWSMDADRRGAIDLLYTLDDGREEGQSILSLAIDGIFLYSGRTGGEVNVWDLETRQLVRSLKAHRDDVLSISIGGGYMFSAAVTGYVRVSPATCELATTRLTRSRNSIVNINALLDCVLTKAKS